MALVQRKSHHWFVASIHTVLNYVLLSHSERHNLNSVLPAGTPKIPRSRPEAKAKKRLHFSGRQSFTKRTSMVGYKESYVLEEWVWKL